MEIVIASKNKGKIKEIKVFFEERDIVVKWLTFEDFSGFPDVEETGDNFMDNAKLKARVISNYTGKLTLGEDSGLEVEFLNGKPGVKSSRYAGEKATDRENREKLLQELNKVKKIEERRAQFACSIVLWHPEDGSVFETTKTCEGFIAKREMGGSGFGYDPIFIPKGYNRTMAQLSTEEKNKISHRGKALGALLGFIENF